MGLATRPQDPLGEFVRYEVKYPVLGSFSLFKVEESSSGPFACRRPIELFKRVKL